MKKEEILEASKKENKNKDIYCKEVEAKGATWAAMCMLILTSIYFIYEIMSGKGQNVALYKQFFQDIKQSKLKTKGNLMHLLQLSGEY